MKEEYNKGIDNRSKLEINPPRLLKYLIDKNSEFVTNIQMVSKTVELYLNRIPIIFPNYTLHDINHSIRIMEYMFDLIEDISKISELDICLLIYSALLHDIGMTATNEEINLIKEDIYPHSEIRYSALLKKFNNEEYIALQEYLRRIHAFRSSEFIKEHLKEYMILKSQPSLNFYEDLCLICQSHTENYQWVKTKLKYYNEKGRYRYNNQFCCILLRLADILDIDSSRTPPALYSLIKPTGISNDEWKQHFIIHNKYKIKSDGSNKQKYIALYGECSDANIHRKILKYIEWINDEIYNSNIITSKMEREYQLSLKYPLENNIEPRGYSLSDLKLNIDFKVISNLLMGEKIYGDKTLGLRELVQNSVDACEVRKEIENSKRKYGEEDYLPIISIILSKETNQVIIKDNGIGMSFSILKKHFLNIGSSYYRSDDFLLKGYTYTPIGNFGIGFLSCFMLSNDVIVKTRYYNDSTVYTLQLTKESEYICLSTEIDVNFEGTEIVLNYNEFMDVMGKRDNVIDFLQKFFLSDVVKIRLVDRDNKFIFENTNKIISLPKCKDGQHFIDLSKYIENSFGYIEVKKTRKNIFIQGIYKVMKKHSLLYFNGKDLIEVSKEFDISQIYRNYSILYIEIGIVDDESEFDRINDVLDDEEETLEKLEGDLEWFTILVDKKIQLKNYNKARKYWDKTVRDIELKVIEALGHSTEYPSKVYVKEELLIYDRDSETVLPLEYCTTKEGIFNPNFLSSVNINLYFRNVLIKDVRIEIPSIISGIKVDGIKINILNTSLITDISRNKLDSEFEEKLGYILGKIIHLWALNNVTHNYSERLLITNFIDMFYKEDNGMMKEINI